MLVVHLGMGPTAHCKHVAAVLFGLCKSSETGEFITAQTCIQKLQTFHHAQKHLGSLVKVDKLMVKVNKYTDYDPRPHNLAEWEGYESFFKNTIVNSGLLSTAPISQILYPANPLAALMDHDYHSPADPVESFLQSEKLTKITEQEVSDLQTATIGQASNPTWKAERLK